MQINLNTSQQNFPILSPIFQHTPILSPLREETLRKYSYNYEELGNFRLESCQDEDYLLFEIQELQQEYHPSECQIKQPISEKKILQPIIEEKVQEQKKQDQKQKPAEKIESEIRNQLNQDSEKDQSQEREYYCQPATELQKLIQYLIQNVNKDQQRIKQEAVKHSEDKETFLKIIPMLLKKFKKTKKTKEQMVKYCMRKSFKYVADKMKQNRTHNRDIDSCMKMYFSKNQTNFSIPFKKNSTQKTMNGSFLKRIFSSSTFVADYKDFLGQFDRLIHQDNFKKIRYLAEFVDTYIKTNEIQKVQSIKRLPWTEDMLQHTLQLSKTLLEYGDKDSPVFTAKRKCE